MNTHNLYKHRRAISPIIATLLLILIAIAAGVVVYAYVVGFIGNSTSNTGGTTNAISIDQLAATSKLPTLTATNNFPVTAYVRNLGPTTESYDTGYYLKSASSSMILGPAVILDITLSGPSVTATISQVTLNESSLSSMTATITLSACTSTSFGVTVYGFGASTSNGGTILSGSCAATSYTSSAFPVKEVVSTLPKFEAQTGASIGAAVGNGFYVIGTTVVAGSLQTTVNTVSTLTLAPQTTTAGQVTANPLSAGTTYTFSVTGTDEATATLSAKAS
ncbi:MAG: archaellin/type IV pilin N-terminal domain-containing protein [Nitrososphaerales archaeon]